MKQLSLIRLVGVFLIAAWFSGCASAQNKAPTVHITRDGKALHKIVISSEATDATKEYAQTLANYLHQISGGDFAIDSSAKVLLPTSAGIALGTAADFPTLSKQFAVNDPTKTEDYLLQTHQNGISLIGATELGLSHAVWDFLYRLGYRQFFPGPNWEIIPRNKNLEIAVDTFQHPSYYSRRIWPGFGALKENRPKWDEWNARNRMASGVSLNTGHAYGAIIHRYKEEFAAHPEYLTKPGGSKFCVSNPGLQKLVIEYALERFAKDPSLQSISMDPSDGGGWESDSCPDSTIYKNVTDRAVTLANLVAEAVNKKHPGKYVGMYAYNEHSPAPTIKVHPNVIPSIATSFIRGGFTLDQLLDSWSKQAQQLGIREYYSVNTWDRDLPGRARGGNIDYLARAIPHFYEKGARFLTAESSDNWGPNGLGYYIATRLMWATSEATNVGAIKADFFEKAFGPAKAPMEKYFSLIDGSGKPLLSSDLLGRMYRHLNEAWTLTNDSGVRSRVQDLVLYTHYVELYSAYSQAAGAARQTAFENLMRFTWRIRGTQMVHTLALWRDLANRDKAMKFPEGSGYGSKEDADPWKSSEPFSVAEIEAFMKDGIANNNLLEFAPVSFSDDLVPATPLNLTSGALGKYSMTRGSANFFTWVANAPTTVALQGSSGLIYANRGNAKLSIYPAEAAEDADGEGAPKPLDSAEIAPGETTVGLTLTSNVVGLNRINISDGSAGTRLAWGEGVFMTVKSTVEDPNTFTAGRWTMYFYVPKGTKVLGGYRNTGNGAIKTPDGKTILDFTAENNPGFWCVHVPTRMDGKVWQVFNANGQINLMTVPPLYARSAAELLLPREVVEADK